MSTRSESISKLAKALLTAQKNIKEVIKDATNPHFGSQFASVGGVIDAVKGPLNEAGIAFLQFPAPSAEGHLAIATLLLHESGEFVEETATMPLAKDDPQGYGSAMTYLRRYGLASIVGLVTVDDDAEAAVGRGVTNTPAAKPSVFKSKLGQFAKKAAAPVRGKTGMFPKTDEEESTDEK